MLVDGVAAATIANFSSERAPALPLLGRLRSRGFRPSPSINLSRRRMLKVVAEALEPQPVARILVVGAGQQVSELKGLISNPRVEIVAVDLDAGANVDVFCDAHNLPFNDEVFHAVVVTAVLEHVADAETVVREMWRVLAGRGLVYSEIPFLQAVHEGPWDFTRFSLGGHRMLFRRFDEVFAGLTAGAGTAAAWALERFGLALVGRISRPGIVSKLTLRALTYPLCAADLFIGQTPEALDAASCTFFLGRKSELCQTPLQIVERYHAGRAR